MNAAVIEEETSHCQNCGAAVDYHYCAVCGQETKLHVPSAHEFLHEFITHYVALEGKLWQSLWLLVRKPGMLTAEYLAGRRARYIQPLRVYLTFSILFFALFKWGGYEVASSGAAPPSETRQVEAGKGAGAEAPKAKEKKAEDGEMNRVEILVSDKVNRWNPKWAAKIDKFDELSAEEKHKVFRTAFFSYAPYAMFCLMPVFAFYLKVLYLGSGRRYGEHLLFALHTNAFAFLIVGLITAIPIEAVQVLLSIWLTLYLPFAMQRVYGGSVWLTVLRWQVLGALHIVSMIVAVVAAFGMAIVS